MDTLEIIINITISTLTGITTGFCAFKFLGHCCPVKVPDDYYKV